MMLHLMLSAILIAGADLTGTGTVPGNWDYGFRTLFQAEAEGGWVQKRPVTDSTSIDAAFSVFALSREVDLLATAAATGNGSDGRLDLRRGRASIRWPGTPWIGGSVHYADRQPFVPGLRAPVADWGWLNIDSISGFGASGGGILGFRAYYLLQHAEGDTLEQLSVFSPWMGFVGFDYYRVSLSPPDSLLQSEEAMNVVAVRSDFRYASPWLVVTGGDGEPGKWAFSGEIRNFRPFSTGWGRIELVPGVSFAGDSIDPAVTAFAPGQRVLSLGAFLESRRYLLSAGLEGMLDLESDSLTGFSASAGMVSSAGVTWDMMLDVFADGDYRGAAAAGTYDGFASAALMLEVFDDSTRLTGSTSYSPRKDVCAELSVSGDLDGSLQPACAVAVSAALGPVRGLVEVDWFHGVSPVFRLNIRGLLE